MSIIKSPEDIEKLKHSALILRSALWQVEKNIKPGITADKLDKIVEEFIKDNGARPAFKGLYGFPNSLITELNEEVVHGLSNKEKIIPENCIVSFDCGVEYQGLYSDMCILLTLGEISEPEKLLVQKTEESLWAGIDEVKAGKKTGDIGFAVNKVLTRAGLGNVLELGGHGLGYEAHCEPHITHKGKKGKGKRLFENQVIAIEPMVTLGSGEVDFVVDKKTGWEIVVSKERVPAAHIEHSLLITKQGCEVLTYVKVEDRLS
jgi:methionyl aminopeptidase